jgi:hypothetical protein
MLMTRHETLLAFGPLTLAMLALLAMACCVGGAQ